MILSNIVIDDIKSKSGLLFDQAKDFEVLAKLILEVTQRSIGITTLKDCWGILMMTIAQIPIRSIPLHCT